MLKAPHRDKFLIAAAFLIGLLTPLLPEPYAALWGLVPLLALEAQGRTGSFLVSFSFYLALSRGIVPGTYVFFRDGSLIRALVLWASSAMGLALPYALLYPAKCSSFAARAARIVFSVLSSVVPPLGLIGWGSPLVAAGIFFPSLGWNGLLLLLSLYALAAMQRFRRAFILVAVALIPFMPLRHPAVPENWKGIDTDFGRLASGSGDFDAQFKRERQVFAEMLRMKRKGEFLSADIILLPETLIGRMNPTTRRRWADFLKDLDESKIFIIGAEIPRGRKYDNVMTAFNDPERQTAIQRCPVPFSMYRPLSDFGANADIFSFGRKSIMTFSGERAGCLICYEQFLTWPFLTLMTLEPNLIAAPANFWWCRETSLPAVRDRTVKLLSALFGVPLLSSVNM